MENDPDTSIDLWILTICYGLCWIMTLGRLMYLLSRSRVQRRLSDETITILEQDTDTSDTDSSHNYSSPPILLGGPSSYRIGEEPSGASSELKKPEDRFYLIQIRCHVLLLIVCTLYLVSSILHLIHHLDLIAHMSRTSMFSLVQVPNLFGWMTLHWILIHVFVNWIPSSSILGNTSEELNRRLHVHLRDGQLFSLVNRRKWIWTLVFCWTLLGLALSIWTFVDILPHEKLQSLMPLQIWRVSILPLLLLTSVPVTLDLRQARQRLPRLMTGLDQESQERRKVLLWLVYLSVWFILVWISAIVGSFLELMSTSSANGTVLGHGRHGLVAVVLVQFLPTAPILSGLLLAFRQEERMVLRSSEYSIEENPPLPTSLPGIPKLSFDVLPPSPPQSGNGSNNPNDLFADTPESSVSSFSGNGRTIVLPSGQVTIVLDEGADDIIGMSSHSPLASTSPSFLVHEPYRNMISPSYSNRTHSHSLAGSLLVIPSTGTLGNTMNIDSMSRSRHKSTSGASIQNIHLHSGRQNSNNSSNNNSFLNVSSPEDIL